MLVEKKPLTQRANRRKNKPQTKKATKPTNQKACYSKPPHPRKEPLRQSRKNTKTNNSITAKKN
jgi:hypothetical protein